MFSKRNVPVKIIGEARIHKYSKVGLSTPRGGGVLDISLGGEVRPGPSNPDPV